MPALYEDARCFGYFGFGGGYEIGVLQLRHGDLAQHRPGGALYCNNECPLRQECWTAHRERVREHFPDAMAEIERLCALHGGPRGVQEFVEAHGSAPPELITMTGNIEDGMSVGFGGQPKDRGPFTLAWPLVPVRPKES